MRNRLLLAIAIGVMGSGGAGGGAFASVSQTAVQTAAEPARFAAGDAAFRERRSDARALEALKRFREAYVQDPTDVQAAWRLAMAC
jgi:hypothetical protein